MSDQPEYDPRVGPFDPERFFEMARNYGHGRALGLEYRQSADDWIELALPWKEELVGVPERGVLATGAIVSLLDTCGGSSVWMALGHFQPLVTIDLRLDYLRPAMRGETVIARCRCYKLTRQVAFVRGLAHSGDENRPIAQAAGTFMLNP